MLVTYCTTNTNTVHRFSRFSRSPPFKIHRRRVQYGYGLVADPADVISDDDLKVVIEELKQHQPYCGVTLVWGSLRAKGVKVTRERVRSMLRIVDPLGRALRCIPGSIRRQPYSVPGPNSLWHIGMLK